MKPANYTSLIAGLKDAILKSRYKAAVAANRMQLILYAVVGKALSEKIKREKWGAGVIERVAADLQKELPGLRGFSYRNLMKMKQFADEYFDDLILPSATAEIQALVSGNIRQQDFLPSVTAEMQKAAKSRSLKRKNNADSEFAGQFFLQVGFTHHVLLLNKCKGFDERKFYIMQAVTNQWSSRILEHHVESHLYRSKGKLPSNFGKTLPAKLHAHALDAFRDEYLLDFINIDTGDERVMEREIVRNIRQFILSMGKGFSFIGNQYRLDVGGQEFFVDLLFYNRSLQCLVAFELKTGKFKPEYAGQLNFYLNVLDEKVRLPHENPSIGIILCKEKNNAVVEYAFRSVSKAMGVATYKLTKEVPKAMKNILPAADELKKLL